jgi:salicylate biosynthesis isochorismate synthase/menaquinone-specific isochorismate synthase
VWFVFEQPDRGRVALAALGEVAHLRASGPERFALVAERWRKMSAAAVGDPAEGDGGGPVALGGFAFAPEGGGAPHWAGFEPASLIEGEEIEKVVLAREVQVHAPPRI